MKRLLMLLLLCTPLFADDAVLDGWIIWQKGASGFEFVKAVDTGAQWNQVVARLLKNGMDCDSLHTVYWELVFPPDMVGIQDNITCTTPSDISVCDNINLYSQAPFNYQDTDGRHHECDGSLSCLMLLSMIIVGILFYRIADSIARRRLTCG